MRRPALDDCRDLFYGPGRSGMLGIEQTAGCDQFRLGHGRMPHIGGPDGHFARHGKTALQDVHVNRRVVEKNAR